LGRFPNPLYFFFATISFLAIAISSFGGMDTLKKIAMPVFHGEAGLIIFLGSFYAKGFFWVGIGILFLLFLLMVLAFAWGLVKDIKN